MKVLVGIKQPRIIYLDDSNEQILGNCYFRGDGYIRLNEGSELEQMDESQVNELVNTVLYSTNGAGSTTWAVITSIVEDGDDWRIYTGDWSASLPNVGAECTSKYYGYDLPYCQNNLIETFTPDIVLTKLYNGSLDWNVKGFWYSIVLDYSKKITPSVTQAFSRLYDATRTYGVMVYPRKDNCSVGYQVDIDPKSVITLAQKMNHLGMKYFKAELLGKYRVSSIGLDPSIFRLVTEAGEPIELVSGEGNYLLRG